MEIVQLGKGLLCRNDLIFFIDYKEIEMLENSFLSGELRSKEDSYKTPNQKIKLKIAEKGDFTTAFGVGVANNECCINRGLYAHLELRGHILGARYNAHNNTVDIINHEKEKGHHNYIMKNLGLI